MTPRRLTQTHDPGLRICPPSGGHGGAFRDLSPNTLSDVLTRDAVMDHAIADGAVRDIAEVRERRSRSSHAG